MEIDRRSLLTSAGLAPLIGAMPAALREAPGALSEPPENIGVGLVELGHYRPYRLDHSL